MTDRYQERVRKWVLYVIETTGMKPSELARRSGLSTTTVTRFLNSTDHKFTLSTKTISKISESVGIPFDEGDTNKPVAVTPRRKEEFASVPIYDIRASAGDGALVEDGSPIGFQPYREQELTRLTRANMEDLAVIRVAGDSMWETLHDGDKVLVDRTVKRIVRDGIYIIAYEDELLVKRCQRDLEDGSVMVSSDNKAYASFKVTDADRLQVLGRVVWIGRALG
ncbi:MAG: helix-turn-helix transcriptional regulator [Pseudomonadota bacterium]